MSPPGGGGGGWYSDYILVGVWHQNREVLRCGHSPKGGGGVLGVGQGVEGQKSGDDTRKLSSMSLQQ